MDNEALSRRPDEQRDVMWGYSSRSFARVRLEFAKWHSRNHRTKTLLTHCTLKAGETDIAPLDVPRTFFISGFCPPNLESESGASPLPTFRLKFLPTLGSSPLPLFWLLVKSVDCLVKIGGQFWYILFKNFSPNFPLGASCTYQVEE